MPTVIDSLVVLLKLDRSSFTEEQKQAVADLGRFTDQMVTSFDKVSLKKRRDADDETKQQRARIEYNRQVADAYRKVTDQVLKLGATLLATGSMVDFVKSTVQMDSSLGRFSERLDLNKDALAVWAGMLANISGSVSTAVTGVEQAVGTLAQLRMQWMLGQLQGPQRGILQLLGVNPAAGDLEDPLKALEKIHERVQHMSTRNATQFLSQLGFGPDMISLLEQRNDVFEKWRKEAEASAPATKAQMDSAEQATRALGRLDAVLRRIAGDAAGPLATVLNHVADIAEEFPGATKAVVDLVAAVVFLRSAAWLTALLLGGGKVGGIAKAAAGAGEGEAAAGGAALLAPEVVVPVIAGAAMEDEGPKVVRKANQVAADAGFHAAGGQGKAPVGPSTAAGAGPVIAPFVGAMVNFAEGFLAAHPKPAGGGAAPPGPAGGGSAPGGGRTPLSVRNNNPGNLVDPKTGEFRHFATMEAGFAAMAAQLLRDFNVHGLKTVADLIGDPHWGWSPANARGNSAASTANYIAQVAKALHVGPHQQLTLDAQTITALANAMAAVEAGPGAKGVHIDKIEINTRATDAKGISKEIASAVAQSARGLS